MSRIIIECGSGNTCRNNPVIIGKMIDEITKIDTHKHEIIFKWQLFEKAGNNIPLDYDMFNLAYWYAKYKGYETTASVFDKHSLWRLLKATDYDPVFVKIANNRDLDYLIGEIPRKIPVYVSISNVQEIREIRNYLSLFTQIDIPMMCVSEYPADITQYEKNFNKGVLGRAISDHTIGLDLFNKYKPAIWEKHFKLKDSTGLDAGEFAITPEELQAIL